MRLRLLAQEFSLTPSLTNLIRLKEFYGVLAERTQLQAVRGRFAERTGHARRLAAKRTHGSLAHARGSEASGELRGLYGSCGREWFDSAGKGTSAFHLRLEW